VSGEVLWIALIALVVLFIGGCGDSDSTANDETTTSRAVAVSNASAEAADVSETDEPECSAEALLAAADSGVVGGVDGNVTSFACTAASLGDLVGGYAWALVEAPGVDPLNVFYSAYEDEAPDGGHVFGDWWVLSYGSDVFCDGDETGIPAEACDLLGDAPRRTDTPAPDEAATADVSETDEPECSAEALLAAADSGVGSPGADAAAIHDPDRSVTSFACTAASLGDLVGGYAWARVEAGSLDPLVIFYSADGGAAYGEWEVLSWGMDATCDEDGEIPVEACDFLTGVPRG
jgi:hypothetical protein